MGMQAAFALPVCHFAGLPKMSAHTDPLARIGQLIDQYRLAQAREQLRALPPQHDSVLQHRVLYLNGKWHYAHGDYEAAEPLLKQAANHHLQSPNPHTAPALHTLGKLHHSQARYAEAEQQFLLAQTHCPEASHAAALIWFDLGQSCRRLGKHAQAQELTEQAAALLESRYGMQHPHTAWVYTRLAAYYRAQNHLQPALSVHQHTYHTLFRTMGNKHPYSVEALMQLARSCYAVGQNTDAAAHFAQALAHSSQCYPKQHPNHARNLYRYAVFCSQTGKHSQAVSLLEQALAIQSEVLGDAHPHTLDSLQGLGEMLISVQLSDILSDLDADD